MNRSPSHSDQTQDPSREEPPILEVNSLSTVFPTPTGLIHAVRDVSFSIRRGETLALVGESGCGKTSVALSVLGLVPRPGRIRSGRIRIGGRDLMELNREERRRLRGHKIAMIFQEPGAVLNPLLKVGVQLREAQQAHLRISKKEAWEAGVKLLKDVGFQGAESYMQAYPHQLSGGQQQRVLIAIALSCRPQVLVADEPTTALDATVQLQILKLLQDLQQRLGLAILFVSHDWGVVSRMAHRVAVMYAGQIVEYGDAGSVLRQPSHPYTQLLLSAVPRLDGSLGRLITIEGNVPDLSNPPSGCYFHPRCPEADEECRRQPPELAAVEDLRRVRCLKRESG